MSNTLKITRELKLALTGIALVGAMGGWYVWNLPPMETSVAATPPTANTPAETPPAATAAAATPPAVAEGGTPAPATATPAAVTPAPGAAAAPVPSAAPAAATQTYTVQPDESLWLIAKAYGTDAQKLADLNGVNINTPLQVGQVLQLPSSAKRLPDPAPAEEKNVDAAALPNLSGAPEAPAQAAPSPQSLPNPFRTFSPVDTPGKPKVPKPAVVPPVPVTPPAAAPAPIVSRLEPVTTPRVSTVPHVALPPVPGLPARPLTPAPVTITPAPVQPVTPTVTPTPAKPAVKPPVPAVKPPAPVNVTLPPRTPDAPVVPRTTPEPTPMPAPVNPVQQTVDALKLTLGAVIVGPVNTAIFDAASGPMYLTTGQVLPGTDIEVRRITETTVTLAKGSAEVQLVISGGQ